MSNYTNLKNAIQSVIKANGNNEITGPILQAELLSMINTLGAGYQYMGVAQPSTNPGTPDARVMYLAYLPGTYVNFGGLTVTGFCVLKYDTVWTKEDIPISGGGGGADFLTEPDDLTLETVGNTQVLKFANRAYNSNTPNGLGYKILRGDLTFAEQVTDNNTVYEIRYDFDLNGATFSLPQNVFLKFNGGKIFNGILQGSVLNRTFDLSDFGILYNDSSVGSQNRNYINIISGITSEFELIVSGNVYFSGNKIELATPKFNITGRNAPTIYLSNFNGFSAKRISAKNLSVNSSVSCLFEIPAFIGSATFDLDNCSFYGDIRVLSSLQYAQDLNHNLRWFIVKNCTFENVYYSGGSNAIFMMVDNIINNTIIDNVIVHNSTAITFHCGITNGSSYQDVIAESKRITWLTNNIFYNDIDFKPWANSSISQPGSYLCFMLMERGECYVRNCLFKHILANNDGCAVYDNYLSVDFLSYENNVWEDNGNLTGEYVLLMKSKAGVGNNGFRCYKNNSYLLSDLSQTLGVEDKRGTTEPQLFYFDSVMDYVEISGNNVKMSGIYCNPYLKFRIKTLVFKNNKILFDSFVKLSGTPCFISITSGLEKWVISDNQIELAGTNSGEISLLGGTDTTGSGNVYVNNNKLSGFTAICSNYNNNDTPFSLNIENNVLSKGNTTLSGSPFLFYGRYAELNLRNNTFEFGSSAPIINGFSKTGTITITLKTHTSAVAVYAFRSANRFPNGIYSGTVTVRNIKTNEIRITQLNFQNNNGTITYAGYDRYGVLNTNIQAGGSVYSKGGGYSGIFGAGFNIQNMLDVSQEYEITVCVNEISDINTLTNIPDAVATTSRPTLGANDAGFSIYDTGLTKPIWWNGTGWVDSTGATV